MYAGNVSSQRVNTSMHEPTNGKLRNQSVSCDDGFLPRAANVEQYPWTTANLTASCTSTCSGSLNSWVSNVQSACGTQPFRNEGYLMLAKAIPLMYKTGYDLACLKSS